MLARALRTTNSFSGHTVYTLYMLLLAFSCCSWLKEIDQLLGGYVALTVDHHIFAQFYDYVTAFHLTGCPLMQTVWFIGCMSLSDYHKLNSECQKIEFKFINRTSSFRTLFTLFNTRDVKRASINRCLNLKAMIDFASS